MSTCDNCVLKNVQPPFARLGTGTTTNALAELIFLILMLIFTLLHVLPAALRAAQTCRYLVYSEADFEVFRHAGATRCVSE